MRLTTVAVRLVSTVEDSNVACVAMYMLDDLIVDFTRRHIISAVDGAIAMRKGVQPVPEMDEDDQDPMSISPLPVVGRLVEFRDARLVHAVVHHGFLQLVPGLLNRFASTWETSDRDIAAAVADVDGLMPALVQLAQEWWICIPVGRCIAYAAARGSATELRRMAAVGACTAVMPMMLDFNRGISRNAFNAVHHFFMKAPKAVRSLSASRAQEVLKHLNQIGQDSLQAS